MKEKKLRKKSLIINDDNDNDGSNKESYIEKKGAMMYCYNKELEHAISKSISTTQRMKSYSKTIVTKHKHLSKAINDNDNKSTDISFSNDIITQARTKTKRAKSYITAKQENTINIPYNSDNNDNESDYYDLKPKPSHNDTSKLSRKQLTMSKSKHISRKKKKLCTCGDCDVCKKYYN